jgi:hypothetical protein
LVPFDEYDQASVRKKWPDPRPAIDTCLEDKPIGNMKTLFGEKGAVRRME